MSCTPERYLLFYAEDVTKDAKSYLVECIETQGLVAEEESCPGQEVIVVGAPFNLLAEEVGVAFYFLSTIYIWDCSKNHTQEKSCAKYSGRDAGAHFRVREL